MKMWMSVRETTGANMAARTSLEDTGVAALRDISSTTSGTSVWMKMNASVHTYVEEPPATTPWEATSACVPPDSSMSSLVEDARMSMNVAQHRPLAAMGAPIRKEATCVAVPQATSGLAKGIVFLEWVWAEDLRLLSVEKWMTIPFHQKLAMNVKSTATPKEAEDGEALMKQMPLMQKISLRWKPQ